MSIDVSEEHVAFIFRVSCFAYSSTLKVEATYFAETSVDFLLQGVISEKIEELFSSSLNFKRVGSGTPQVSRGLLEAAPCPHQPQLEHGVGDLGAQ
jgi:hypothetical protein